MNDTRVHAAPDKLLQTVAERLRNCARARGQYRGATGRREFTIQLRGITDGKGLKRVLRKVIKFAAQPGELGEFNATVTASIGINFYPTDATGIEKLLIHADEAMYQAKQAGKNRYVAYGQKKANGLPLEWQNQGSVST